VKRQPITEQVIGLMNNSQQIEFVRLGQARGGGQQLTPHLRIGIICSLDMNDDKSISLSLQLNKLAMLRLTMTLSRRRVPGFTHSMFRLQILAVSSLTFHLHLSTHNYHPGRSTVSRSSPRTSLFGSNSVMVQNLALWCSYLLKTRSPDE
jgi:hypothetical protein